MNWGQDVSNGRLVLASDMKSLLFSGRECDSERLVETRRGRGSNTDKHSVTLSGPVMGTAI